MPIFLYGYLLIELSPNQELRPFRKACSPISLDTARKFLDDDRLLFTCLLDGKERFKRGFPKEFALQENAELAELLRKVHTHISMVGR